MAGLAKGPILVFDSGVGGLSVLAAARTLLPSKRFIYVADDAAFPYGNWTDDALLKHILEKVEALVATYAPQAIVVACNTASTLVLPALRQRFPETPIVGTVPAIKPAALQTQSGVIAVLATPATIARDYTRTLMQQYAAGVQVALVASRHLAAQAEQLLHHGTVDADVIRQEIAPCFATHATGRTDHVVLGCTHYPLLLEQLRLLAPWPVEWIDPSVAIARQLAKVVGEVAEDSSDGGAISENIALFTSGAPVPAAVAAILAR